MGLYMELRSKPFILCKCNTLVDGVRIAMLRWQGTENIRSCRCCRYSLHCILHVSRMYGGLLECIGSREKLRAIYESLLLSLIISLRFFLRNIGKLGAFNQSGLTKDVKAPLEPI